MSLGKESRATKRISPSGEKGGWTISDHPPLLVQASRKNALPLPISQTVTLPLRSATATGVAFVANVHLYKTSKRDFCVRVLKSYQRTSPQPYRTRALSPGSTR